MNHEIVACEVLMMSGLANAGEGMALYNIGDGMHRYTTYHACLLLVVCHEPTAGPLTDTGPAVQHRLGCEVCLVTV